MAPTPVSRQRPPSVSSTSKRMCPGETSFAPHWKPVARPSHVKPLNANSALGSTMLAIRPRTLTSGFVMLRSRQKLSSARASPSASVTPAQFSIAVPPQAPAEQASPCVHASPSSQAVPSDLAGFEQTPEEGSHSPAR